MAVVLDTNVIVAALVAKGLCHEVVVRAKFTLGPAANGFLKQLRIRVRLAEPMTLPSPVARDVDDDVVLATAVAAGGVIVTVDQDLLVIGRYKEIDIVSPREFLTRLSS